MKQHACFNYEQLAELSENIRESTYALYWHDAFLGSCVAIASKLFISAGHHFNLRSDDVADFTILVGHGKWFAVEYVTKNSTHDLLVLWTTNEVKNYTTLRGFLPAVGARVMTVWRSPRPPHEIVISPGEVIESEAELCTVRGTVSTTGSSGAPVVDGFGEHVVGLHLTSNTKNGSRVSGFITARKLVALLSDMAISCRNDSIL